MLFNTQLSPLNNRVGSCQTVITERPSLLVSKEQWITIVLAVVVSRLAFYVIGLLGAQAFNPESTAGLDVWHQVCRFDCIWFQRIADNGYDLVPTWMKGGNAANWAFMPMSPFLGWLMAKLTGSTELALIIVSNITFFLSVPVFLMALKQLKFSVETQEAAIWLLCFSPYTVYSMAGYSEPLYIALVSGVFLACYRQQWAVVALLGMLAAVTRNLGVMLVFPVLIFGVQYYGVRSFMLLKEKALRVVLSIWLIPLGFFSYMAYLHFWMGDALAFGHIQIAWGRTLTNPLHWLSYGVEQGGPKLYLVIVTLFGVGLNVYLFAKKRYAEAVFMMINLLIPLSSGVNAMPRYIFGLYPTLLAILMLFERYPRTKAPVLLVCSSVSSLIAIGFFSKLFFTV
ncbi:hypothetical protein [Vibrio sp. 10N.261.51.F12]|uniref:hypothetical protein n=1 Tax=Vibrio sp. 10N.261.51.F12 TaxID=3229679 RepID=UPI0035521EE2